MSNEIGTIGEINAYIIGVCHACSQGSLSEITDVVMTIQQLFDQGQISK